jgi:catechol 2,3-dioxygenase-like lactoylglutathione lyase family enzyme
LIAYDHTSLTASNLDPHLRFWTALGGRRSGSAAATTAVFEFAGTWVAVQTGSTSGGTVGSILNHICFQVPHTEEAAERWRGQGITVDSGGFAGQAWMMAPDAIRVEILEDPQQTVPIRAHHLHFFTPAPLEMIDWYARTLGAVPGKRLMFDAADVPKMNLTFSPTDTAVAPTRGRAIDHIGFAVDDLEAWCARLADRGERIERATESAFLVDPWGTRIELVPAWS